MSYLDVLREVKSKTDEQLIQIAAKLEVIQQNKLELWRELIKANPEQKIPMYYMTVQDIYDAAISCKDK